MTNVNSAHSSHLQATFTMMCTTKVCHEASAATLRHMWLNHALLTAAATASLTKTSVTYVSPRAQDCLVYIY